MPAVTRESSTLLVVDFQSKLMPAIDGGMSVVGNARRLLSAAEMLQVPILVTEQNANGLGSTVPELRSDTSRLVHKMTFDACRTAGFLETIADRHDLIVSGCEAHDSPHFHTAPKVSAKTLTSASMAANPSTSGLSLCSGIVGMRS